MLINKAVVAAGAASILVMMVGDSSVVQNVHSLQLKRAKPFPDSVQPQREAEHEQIQALTDISNSMKNLKEYIFTNSMDNSHFHDNFIKIRKELHDFGEKYVDISVEITPTHKDFVSLVEQLQEMEEKNLNFNANLYFQQNIDEIFHREPVGPSFKSESTVPDEEVNTKTNSNKTNKTSESRLQSNSAYY